MADDLVSISELPCCPEITREPCCERLQFTYRLVNRLTDIPVEVVITAEIERCPGPLALGDVVWSNTLLPGEKVRLFTSTRNNRFTFDSESKVSYRHETASEETYYMTAVDRYMSDLTIADQGGGSASSESEFQTEGSVSNWTDAIFGRPDARVEGEFSAESSFDFFRDLRRHAESSHERSVQGTRAANSIAMGEVQSRSHAEGESEDAYEASTRVIENKNECHAVTYFAYQLVKRQTVTFRIVSVLRRVIEQAGDVGVAVRPLRPNPNVAVLPSGVLATNTNRITIQQTAQAAAAQTRANFSVGQPVSGVGPGAVLTAAGRPVLATAAALSRPRPLATDVRRKAVDAVDKELVRVGILDKVGGQLSPNLAAELEFSRTTCLPTQAVVVKGCIDTCNVCEESRQKAIDLDLKRRDLENKLLARQIELLEKSQDYRCCPAGQVEALAEAPSES